MGNLKRLNLENYPSFITTKTINNYSFFNNPENAEILISTLYFGRENNWFSLIAFVVMSDHLHLIIIPQKKNISQAMHSIKSFSSKAINKITNAAISKATLMSFPLVGSPQRLAGARIFLKNPEGLRTSRNDRK